MIQPGNAGYRNEYKDGEDEMKRNILIYNNQTGIAEKMVPLCAGEDLSVLVAADVEDLYDILHRSEIHLMLVDVELNDKGWDKGIEMIAGLRRSSSIPLIVVSKQSAETAKIMALEDKITAAQIYSTGESVCQY